MNCRTGNPVCANRACANRACAITTCVNPVYVILAYIFLLSTPSYAQDHPAELTSLRTDIQVRNGVLHKTMNYEIRINNRAGEKYTQVSIPFSKIIKVSGIEASILDRYGNVIRKLKNADITERHAISQGSFYADQMIREFSLKHNEYPYTLCYSYELRQEEFLFLDHWMPLIAYDIPTENAMLHVELPNGYQVDYREKYTDGFTADSTDERVSYTWQATYDGNISSETYAPPAYQYVPSVVIVPRSFQYDLPGTSDSWLSIGNWHYDLNLGLSDLPESEKALIRSRVSGISDDKEKVRTLYHDLQDATRYINITIETGGFRPYPASYVAANKYGDCKALTNYFRAVLECAGIPSVYAIVWAGDPIRKVDRDFPSQQFNHIILCIPMEQDTIWLDCTSDGPFDYLGTFTQNRNVLLVEKDNSHLVRTPALRPDDVLECRKVVFYRDAAREENIYASLNLMCRGDAFETLSFLSRSYNESDRSKIIRNNFIESGFDMIAYELPEPNRDAEEIRLMYTATASRFYSFYGKDVLMELLPFSMPSFEIPEDRKLPVQIDHPLLMVDSLEYHIPEGYEMAGELLNRSISCEFGHYRISCEQDQGILRICKEFLLHAGEYTLEQYPDLYAFMNEVSGIENKTIIVATKSELNEGK